MQQQLESVKIVHDVFKINRSDDLKADLGTDNSILRYN